jgi:hypothetical protein
MDDARRIGAAAMRGAIAIRIVCVALLCAAAFAQAGEYERAFPQSKASVEKALKEMQAATGGRLPVLDGFATPGDHPLESYKRGYYQARFQVSAAPSGGSIVRVSARVTAWYNDPVASKSGYQLLNSNGRLEGDLLDQLSDQLAGVAPAANAESSVVAATKPARAPEPTPPPESAPPPASAEPTASAPAMASAQTPVPPPEPAAQPGTPPATAASNEPSISAPMPRIPESEANSSVAHGLAEKSNAPPSNKKKKSDEESGGPLQSELDGLQEILKNQAHPKNLVAVKNSGTPVVSSASLSAKTLFMASAHDEFEMLDYNRDWVHVRIAGLSRGWIWRASLEMPSSVPNTDAAPKKSALPAAAELFHVSREETAPFPGDWAPLRGMRVKIVSVEDSDDNAKTDSLLRLEFAKSVLDRDYAELAQKTQELAGIVLIFDSADGGMIAATFTTLQQWKAGKLSDAALWHACFFDPPETFGAPGTSSSSAADGKPSGNL